MKMELFDKYYKKIMESLRHPNPVKVLPNEVCPICNEEIKTDSATYERKGDCIFLLGHTSCYKSQHRDKKIDEII